MLNSPAAGAMLSAAAFAELLGISRRTFKTWRAAGKVPPPDFQIGQTLRWRRSTINAFIERHAPAAA